jgi:hypothetical protein
MMSYRSMHKGTKARVSRNIQTTSLLFQATQKKHRMAEFEKSAFKSKAQV